ncbi:hypothetical protein [Actinacidiphila alni]|uniref:hypothetical protein n=1 Tax=Actinacidiphila alni TaxID=380248 RepID=UPI001160668C|nr:hypothetical protein [Actinacidiphila alni]
MESRPAPTCPPRSTPWSLPRARDCVLDPGHDRLVGWITHQAVLGAMHTAARGTVPTGGQR